MREIALVLSLIFVLVRIAPALADEPKFSAADVLNGLAWNGEGCAEAGRIKVEVDGKPDCLRFYGSTSGTARGGPVIFFEGDVVAQTGQATTGQPVWTVGSFYTNLSPAMMQADAQRFAVAADRTFINLARPGTFGSTGNHMQRRREREVALVDAALDRLKARFGWTSMTLAGESGGGHLVASLIARRNDIGCAVIASGNVAVRLRAAGFGLTTDFTGYADFFDPIDHVSEVASHPPQRIIMLTDPEDKIVPASSQAAYRDALRAVGVNVEQRSVVGYGPGRHEVRVPAIVAGLTCTSLSTR
jgi:dienelactone hydrolase